MLLSHRRIPFDNKICLGQWIEARPPSLPRPSLGPAMKLLERISNFFKNMEQVLGCRPCQVLPLASMLTASSSASWFAFVSAFLSILKMCLAVFVTGCVIPTETTLGPALVVATGRSGTIVFPPSSRPGHQRLASTLNLRLLPPRLEHQKMACGKGLVDAQQMFTSRTGAFMVQRLSTWQSRRGCASGLALLKMAAGRQQTTKLASVPTTTPKPRAPLKGCSLSLLSLKHALAVGHLQPLLGNSSRVPSLVALVSPSPF